MPPSVRPVLGVTVIKRVRILAAAAAALAGIVAVPALASGPHHARHSVRDQMLVVHGSWQNPLPCGPTNAAVDPDAKTVSISGCIGTSTWTGTLTGATTSTQAGTIYASGAITGTVDETFTGVDVDDAEASQDPTPSSLRTLYRFSIDANGVFRAVGRIVGGTGAWAGRDGCSLFVGTFVGAGLGSGGYTIDWNLHPSAAQLSADSTATVSADRDPCTVTAY